jgi:outer membrane protein assembly factor BamB
LGARKVTLNTAGRILTEASPASRTASQPVEDGDTRYVAVYQQAGTIVVSARDRVTRAVRWSTELTSSDVPDLNAGSGVVVVSPPGPAGFTILDGKDGKLLWAVTTRGSRAVAGGGDDRVYVIGPGRVVASDSRTGAARWRVSAPDSADPDLPIMVASSPTRVVIAQGNRLIIYDQDGRKVAAAGLPGAPASGLFLVRDRVYAAVAGTPSRGGCD